MTNQKLIRSTFLAAAMSVSAAGASTAFGVEQGQYQPGQPGKQIPQGNTSVTQELNRMFQESGQQMPSMNPQELPNANAPTQGQIRPLHPENPLQSEPHGNSKQMQPANGSKNPGRLSRFFQKLRGKPDSNTTPDNLSYRPPVPPDYQNAGSSTAATGARNGQPQGQKQLPQQSQSSTNAPRPATAQINQGSKASATPAAHSSTQNSTQNSTQDSTQFTNGAMSRIPPRSGATVRPTGSARPVPSSPGAAGERTTYTQPGSAPGFMSTAGVSTVIQKQPAAPPLKDKFQEEFIRENAGEAVNPRIVRDETKTTAAASVAAKDAVSGFENPFLDTRDSIEAAELLDLDSLIEIPRATAEPVQADVLKTRPVVQVPAASAELETPQAQKARVVREPQEPVTTNENVLSEEAVEPINENPFTGVQLDASEASVVAGQDRVSEGESATFGTPVAPMEDFNSDLPAIDLPPVEDEDSTDVDVTEPNPAPESSETAIEAAGSSADDSGRAELQSGADVPSAMNAADTERLRQTAEQERRQRQQRQILVRAGQTGFKGFCPVMLRERRELVEANPQFTSTFGLQTYTFSSAESKIAFDSDPSRYAPAAGGSDVVVLVNSGEEQAGQLDYALWYRDRLYLFRSRETMTLFSKDPQRFASQY